MSEREATISHTLYIFIDESGNFDFSPKGTKHYVVNALATFEPVMQREELVRYRYELLREGYDQEYFHASEDQQFVRDEVFRLLGRLQGLYELHTVWVQKNKAHPSLYEESYEKKGRVITRTTGLKLYQKLNECLLRYIFQGKGGAVDRIVVVIGSLFTGEKKKVFLKTLKHYLKTNFPGVEFDVYCHPVGSDLNCQLADYCSWAQYVRLERGETRPYSVIAPSVKSNFDYFGTGTTLFYEYDE